ncbi:MAG: hypothetical protein ACOYEV_04990 [Candidatus Nanopelagicales bacterium]
MDMLAAEPPPPDPDRLELELRRCSERLRSMSLVRLGAATSAGSRAAQAFGCARTMVELNAGLAGQPARALPDLPDHAAGDVLAVTGHDLLQTVRANPAAAGEVTATAVEALVALRLAL